MKLFKQFVVLVFILFPVHTFAAILYCGPSSTGAGTGANFSNLMALPNTTGFVRGNIYVVIDGSYGNRTLSTAASGSSIITIRKANAAQDSGVTGYSSSLSDGTAVFGYITVTTNYWYIDGITRNECLGWCAPTGYGISATAVSSDTYNGQNASYSTFRYMDIGPTYSETMSGINQVVYLVYNQTNITFHKCAFHNAVNYTLIQGAGSDNITIEYCYLGPGWGKEAIRAGNQNFSSGWIIRHNKFWNSVGGNEGLTAEIGIWDWTGTSSGYEIYGNWFFNSRSGFRNSCIVVGGNGSSWKGGGADGTLVYNNTIAAFPNQSVFSDILLNGSSTIARNNLAYDLYGTFNVSATTTSNNTEVSSNPFIDYAGINLRLSAGIAGYGLSSPYNTDMDGNTRGYDGIFDMGAFEYTGEDTTAPTVSSSTPPSIASNGETVTINFSESVVTTGYDDGDFNLDCTTAGDDIALNSISGTGSTRTFSAASIIGAGDTCNLDYTGGANEIEDAAGNDLATFSNTAVTNYSTQLIDTDPPEVSTAVIGADGLTVTITFNEVVVTTGYDAGDFNIDCNTAGQNISLSSPSGSGTSRTFTSATLVYQNDLCNLDYVGGADDITDTVGNDMVTFSDTSVTSNSEVPFMRPVRGVTISSGAGIK